MKIKITQTDVLNTLVPMFEGAGKTGADLETAVNELITKSYEVVDDKGEAVEFKFKVKAAPAAAPTIDTKELETKFKAMLDAQEKSLREEISKRPKVEVIDPVTLPKHAKIWGRNRNITKEYVGHNEDPMLVAYRFGQWCMAAMGHTKAMEYCKTHGLPHIKLHQENNNNTGAVLVPEEFDNMIIVLREKFGVFRANAKIVPMTTETKRIPRRIGGLQAFPVGEAAAASESTKGWDQVQLTAKDWMVLSRYTGQLDDDAVISIGDDLAGECAYAFAGAEDDAGFNGDGTSTYSGIQGVRTKLKNVNATIANIAGLVVASGTGYATSWGSITLADFNKVVGILPEYADTPNVAWYCSRTFWGTVIQRLQTAAGGNRVADIQGGARVKEFLGYPVRISQKMPRTSATSQVACLFGDLGLAAKMGNRRDTSIEFSREASIGGQSLWERNEIGIRAIERFDINVHDVGDASGNAGPIVGLITAAS